MKNLRFHIICAGKVLDTAATGGRALEIILQAPYTYPLPPEWRCTLSHPVFVRERCICYGEHDETTFFYNAAGQRIFDAGDVPEADRLAEIAPEAKL